MVKNNSCLDTVYEDVRTLPGRYSQAAVKQIENQFRASCQVDFKSE